VNRVSFGILGPLTASSDGAPLRLGGQKERLVLASLLVAGGRVVSVEQLVDVLWGEQPPERAVATLQVHVSNVRRRLGDGQPSIVTQTPGYALPVTSDSLDLLRFEELGAAARDAIAAGDPERAADLLSEADSLWRGDPLADLEPVPHVTGTRAFLEERRASLGELRVETLLAAGRPAEALPVISHLLRAFPLRESIWQMRMVALYRLGRQAEALASYAECRERLLDELGVEPTTALREMQRAILNQDASLDVVQPQVTAAASRPPEPPEPSVTFMVGQHAAELVIDETVVVPLTGNTTVGRHPESDVVLSDVSVSRRHAEIRPAMGGHLLTDLSSSNGTHVSGQPVLHHLLEDGDEIRIGPHRLLYRRGQQT
jgi:DNA-binding SARP family transcriptional activator